MSANKKERLDPYRAKRTPEQTPEPFGEVPSSRPGAFVVQKHAARSTHYDLRLERGGVLWSWAVPRGISRDPAEKRLAVQTEDHPVEYVDFEGVIPEGSYGAGAMIVWDRGRWVALEDPEEGLEKGKLLFELRGYKLRGVWTLVKTKRAEKEWLLIKKPDQWASTDDEPLPESSVLSGLTVEQLGDGGGPAARLSDRLDALGVDSPAPVLGDIELTLATSHARPFSRQGWIFEIKYDGYRLLAERRDQRVRLRYRSGLDATGLYPELTRALMASPVSHFVLDGEVVILDDEGRPSFQRLQKRGQRRRPVEVGVAMEELPATFFVFDLLALDGRDLRSLPLLQRKELLRELVPPLGPVCFVDHLQQRGEAFFEQIRALGLEGMVAKKADSPYRGGRGNDWQKIHADRVGVFVVVGSTAPKGGRSGFGALHLAAFRDEQLQYAGRVGTGFSQQELDSLAERLAASQREDPACQGALPKGPGHRWVEPELAVRVRYKELTEAGQLRQPRYEGLAEVPLTDCLWPGGPAAEPVARKPQLTFSNLDKVFWPEQGYTKGDLIDYYRRVSGWLLPYLTDRPLVLDRYPDGIDGKSFFQKNAPGHSPDWIHTEQIWSDDATRGNDYFVCDNEESLLYIANLAAIPLHIWGSRLETIDRPDWCILDLDPKDAPFEHAVEVALGIRALCDSVGIPTFVKTSGGDGLHVLVPLGARYSFDQCRMLAEVIARLTVSRFPEIATVERSLASRGGKLYVDYLQNGRGKLLAAPLCVRPKPAAPVSTPLAWNEVEPELDPTQLTMATVPDRLADRGDPLRPVLTETIDLPETLARLAEELQKES